MGGLLLPQRSQTRVDVVVFPYTDMYRDSPMRLETLHTESGPKPYCIGRSYGGTLSLYSQLRRHVPKRICTVTTRGLSVPASGSACHVPIPFPVSASSGLLSPPPSGVEAGREGVVSTGTATLQPSPRKQAVLPSGARLEGTPVGREGREAPGRLGTSLERSAPVEGSAGGPSLEVRRLQRPRRQGCLWVLTQTVRLEQVTSLGVTLTVLVPSQIAPSQDKDKEYWGISSDYVPGKGIS